MDIRQITHPEDAKAMKMLRRTPFLRPIVKLVMKEGLEKQMLGELLAQTMLVTSENMPELHDILVKTAHSIGIKPTPALYIYNDPQPNAYTYGETSTFIAVSSGLLDIMNNDELTAVIAHECGHIACHHTFYKSLLNEILYLGDFTIGISFGLLGPIELSLMYWSRRAEFSADRFSVLVAGEEATQSALLKLACGCKNITGRKDQLIVQAQQYFAMQDESTWNKIQQNCRMAFYSHPQMCIRAYEAHRWSKSFFANKH